MTELPVSEWLGCYDSSWSGLLCKDSFVHPAKFARGLIERILDHGVARGYWKAGDDLGDPFGGVGCGAVVASYRGFRWIGNELEKKFVDIGRQNIELHRDRLQSIGAPEPILLNGDSREFDVVIDGGFTSPPYETISAGAGGLNHKPAKKPGQQSGRAKGPSQDTDQRYGDSPGQISRTKSIDGGLFSPPYADSVNSARHGIDFSKQKPDYPGRVNHAERQAMHDKKHKDFKYGDTPGQIGALKGDKLDGGLTSPPFTQTKGGAQGIVRDGYKGDQGGGAPEKLGERTYLGQGGDGVIGSPPHGNSLDTGGPEKQHPDGYERSNNWTGYGKDPGQIGRLPVKKLDGGVLSPPHAETPLSTDRNFKSDKCPDRPEARGANKDGYVDGGITSPPYSEGLSHGGGKARLAHDTRGTAESALQGYGETEGQIGGLKVDGGVTSPPWEDQVEGGFRKGKFKSTESAMKAGRGHGATDEAREAQLHRDEQKTYGDSPGQIGTLKKETYWEAMSKVYSACFRAIKPGGVMAVVVKDFVKKKKRVRLCDDTLRLLEHVGFVGVERVHAMLVDEDRHIGLFGDDVVVKRERKSFFRRLHEQKLEPGDDRRIDFEEVIFVRKPV